MASSRSLPVWRNGRLVSEPLRDGTRGARCAPTLHQHAAITGIIIGAGIVGHRRVRWAELLRVGCRGLHPRRRDVAVAKPNGVASLIAADYETDVFSLDALSSAAMNVSWILMVLGRTRFAWPTSGSLPNCVQGESPSTRGVLRPNPKWIQLGPVGVDLPHVLLCCGWLRQL